MKLKPEQHRKAAKDLKDLVSIIASAVTAIIRDEMARKG